MPLSVAQARNVTVSVPGSIPGRVYSIKRHKTDAVVEITGEKGKSARIGPKGFKALRLAVNQFGNTASWNYPNRSYVARSVMETSSGAEYSVKFHPTKKLAVITTECGKKFRLGQKQFAALREALNTYEAAVGFTS